MGQRLTYTLFILPFNRFFFLIVFFFFLLLELKSNVYGSISQASYNDFPKYCLFLLTKQVCLLVHAISVKCTNLLWDSDLVFTMF